MFCVVEARPLLVTTSLKMHIFIMVSIRSETSSLRRFLVSHNNSVTTIGEMEIHRRLHLKVGGMEKIYQMHWLLYLLMHEEPLLMHYKLD